MKYTFNLPCYMQLGNKKISLNLNWYRNAHYYIMANVKREYRPSLIPERFHANKIEIEYIMVLSSNHRTDTMNWVSIVDKFFLDWLVCEGFIDDDNMSIYNKVSISTIIDKNSDQNYIIANVIKLA